MRKFWRELARLITLFDKHSPSIFLRPRIGEFFRKMARPAGFEPATLGLEGPPSDRLSIDGYHPRRLDGLDLENSRRFLLHFAVSSPHIR